MARNGLKIANLLGCAFRFESDFRVSVSENSDVTGHTGLPSGYAPAEISATVSNMVIYLLSRSKKIRFIIKKGIQKSQTVSR